MYGINYQQSCGQHLTPDKGKRGRERESVHASSVNVFKNRIDKYLAKAGYI